MKNLDNKNTLDDGPVAEAGPQAPAPYDVTYSVDFETDRIDVYTSVHGTGAESPPGEGDEEPAPAPSGPLFSSRLQIRHPFARLLQGTGLAAALATWPGVPEAIARERLKQRKEDLLNDGSLSFKPNIEKTLKEADDFYGADDDEISDAIQAALNKAAALLEVCDPELIPKALEHLRDGVKKLVPEPPPPPTQDTFANRISQIYGCLGFSFAKYRSELHNHGVQDEKDLKYPTVTITPDTFDPDADPAETGTFSVGFDGTTVVTFSGVVTSQDQLDKLGEIGKHLTQEWTLCHYPDMRAPKALTEQGFTAS